MYRQTRPNLRMLIISPPLQSYLSQPPFAVLVGYLHIWPGQFPNRLFLFAFRVSMSALFSRLLYGGRSSRWR